MVDLLNYYRAVCRGYQHANATNFSRSTTMQILNTVNTQLPRQTDKKVTLCMFCKQTLQHTK